jgi:restriction endonuclease Mrr
MSVSPIRSGSDKLRGEMAIPKAKATKQPILDFLADGLEHIDEEIQEYVARHFRLTRKEREVVQANGIPVYKNRTAWGLVHLQNPLYLPHTRPFIKKTRERRSGQEV